MLLIIIIITTAFIIVAAKVSGKEPNFFGYEMKTVLSGSMEPELQTGSIIIIEQTDKNKLKAGDIITFATKENILVTHRIIESTESGYITKGDSNNGVDINPVTPKNIIGKYSGVTIPYVGYVMFFVNTKLGGLLLLIIPGIYLIGISLINIRRSTKQEEKNIKETIVNKE